MSNNFLFSSSVLSRKDISKITGKAKSLAEKQKSRQLAAMGPPKGDQPRRPEQSTLIAQVNELGALYAVSHKVSQLVKLFEMCKDSALMIRGQANWTWEQRFAVGLIAARFSANVPAKSEMMVLLKGFNPRSFNTRVAGFDLVYNYVASFTEPRLISWLIMVANLPREWNMALHATANVVYTPPLITNIIGKAKRYTVAPHHNALVLKLIRERVKLVVPEGAFDFEPLPSFEGEKTEVAALKLAAVVSSLVQWLAFQGDAFILKATSPGSPWIMTKPAGALGWGNCHSEAFLRAMMGSSDEPGVFTRFLTAFTSLVLKDAKAYSAVVGTAKNEAMESGAKLYEGLRSMTIAVLDNESSDFRNFWSHVLWIVQAGNVKPVTTDEIKLGKPDRAVYSSSALMRLISLRFSYLLYEAMVHPAYSPHFSWAKGGASRFLDELMRDADDDVVLSRYPGHDNLRSISLRNCVVAMPDVTAMDLNMQGEYQDLCFSFVADMILLGPKGERDPRHLVLLSLLGFVAAASKKPMVLWGNDVIAYPTSLNPSGGAFTFLVNEIKSFGISAVMENLSMFKMEIDKIEVSSEYLSHSFVKHCASGDDQLFLVKVAPMLGGLVNEETGFARGERAALVSVNDRDESGVLNSRAQLVLQELNKFYWGLYERPKEGGGRDVVPGHPGGEGWTLMKKSKTGLLHKVAKIVGFAWKQETCRFSSSLSEFAYLGHHIIATVEGGEAGLQFLAARPPPKLMHNLVWPHHVLRKKSTVTPALFDALRALAVYLEGAVAYPELRLPCQMVYSNALTQCGVVNWEAWDLKQQLYNLVGDKYSLGDDPAAVLEEVGFVFGVFPTLEEVWLLATGEDLPEVLSEDIPKPSSPLPQTELDWAEIDWSIPSLPPLLREADFEDL